MKKAKLYIIFIICILLSGCGKKVYLEDYTKPVDEGENVEYEQDRFTFLGESSGRRASSGNGLYYIERNNEDRRNEFSNIYYYDFNQKKSNIWCNKIDCNHNTSACTSYTTGSETGSEFVEYHMDKVYTKYNDDKGTYLIQYDIDGNNQNKLANLIPENTDFLRLQEGRFYNNIYYYSIINTSNQFLYYSLDLSKASQPQKLFELDSESTSRISTTTFVNDMGLYVIESVFNDTSKSSAINIYTYQFSDKSLTKIVDKVSGIRTTVNDKVYCIKNGEGLFSIDTSGVFTHIDCSLLNNLSDGFGLYSNEKYIVLDNFTSSVSYNAERTIIVYNIEKNIAKEFYPTRKLVDEDTTKESVSISNIQETGNSNNPNLAMFPTGLDANNYYFENAKENSIYAIKLDSVFDDKLSCTSIELE